MVCELEGAVHLLEPLAPDVDHVGAIGHQFRTQARQMSGLLPRQERTLEDVLRHTGAGVVDKSAV
jgi:hypothetical protein